MCEYLYVYILGYRITREFLLRMLPSIYSVCSAVYDLFLLDFFVTLFAKSRSIIHGSIIEYN